MKQKLRVPLWLGICIMCLFIATFVFLAVDDANSPKYRDTRTPREQRIDKELQRENEKLNLEIQKELRRIENKN
jgi:large-conductance mechanosensitive channel